MNAGAEEALKELELQYFGENMHESAEIERLPELLDGVRCFVDVGASLGQYSYFAAVVTNEVEYICIEADPYKARRLRELTQKWAAETNNRFRIVERAASDRSEAISFFIPESHRSSGAFFPLSSTSKGWEKVDVLAETLDQLLDGVAVDFMKLDVEGAEYRALVGAEGLMKRCDLQLLLEIAPWGDIDRSHRPSDVLKLLCSYGYDFSVFEDHYLFEKKGNRIVRWLKSRILGFVLDRPRIKIRVKNVFNRIRQR